MSGKHNVVVITNSDGIVEDVLLNGILVDFWHIDLDPLSYDGDCPICRYPLIRFGEHRYDDGTTSGGKDICTNCGWNSDMASIDSANHKVGWETIKEENK